MEVTDVGQLVSVKGLGQAGHRKLTQANFGRMLESHAKYDFDSESILLTYLPSLHSLPSLDC